MKGKYDVYNYINIIKVGNMEMTSQIRKALIITNVPSPYRVDFFYYLQSNFRQYQFYILYSSVKEDNRQWEIDSRKLINSYFLKSKTIKIKGTMDYKYIHVPWGARKKINKINPDIIIGMEYNPTVLVALQWCLKMGKPYISWTDGTLNSEKNINAIQKLVRRYTIKNSAAYIASSSSARENQIFYGALSEKIFISFLTINIKEFMQPIQKRNENQIIYVGGLIKRKGVDLLIEALANIEENFYLVIVGDGPERRNLENQCIKCGLSDKVCFKGYLHKEQLLDMYRQSSIFILPTREDCFALVILEAMCSGLPIISSKFADGSRDLIDDKKGGFIIDPYDQKQFSSCIKMLLTNPDMRKKLGEYSQLKAYQFQFSEVSKNFIHALESVE